MSEAVINSQMVKCLRDTGSTITLVKNNLIKDIEPAREFTVCTTAFGTRHTIPLGLTVKTTYGVGKIKVGMVDDLPVDCILGNDILKLNKIENVEMCAAITRSKDKAEKQAINDDREYLDMATA